MTKGKKRAVMVRLDPDILRRLDAYAKVFEAEHPGLSITRTDVVRMFLEQGCDAAEKIARGKP